MTTEQPWTWTDKDAQRAELISTDAHAACFSSMSVDWLCEKLTAAVAEIEAMRSRKDAAYLERNRVVALLSVCFPAVRTRTAIDGWSEDWHGCVYIWLPGNQQCSWHFHDSHAHLFEHLPELAPGTVKWDGHTTEEKYERIARAVKELKDDIVIR